MPATPISTANAGHYTWGKDAPAGCDAWYLVRTPDLHILEELMPPGTSETPHHHTRARQFFYVLAGELTLSVEGQPHTLHAHQGLEIAPGELHQAINRSDSPVRFLVTSHPPSHGDRIDHLAPGT
jgi:mannose-6-phosphate isomerase-like protein (cupin superfamily)